MSKDYAFLSPIQVGPMKLKNRIIYPAMGKSLADDEGYVTDRYVEYFRTIAKGGVALITTGIMVIDPSWHYISVRQPWLSDDKFIPGLKLKNVQMETTFLSAVNEFISEGGGGAIVAGGLRFGDDDVRQIAIQGACPFRIVAVWRKGWTLPPDEEALLREFQEVLTDLT